MKSCGKPNQLNQLTWRSWLPSGKRTVCYWTWPSRNSWFSHEKLCFSIVVCTFTRYHPFSGDFFGMVFLALNIQVWTQTVRPFRYGGVLSPRATPESSGWWFQTFSIFHNIWDVILPIDFHIFQDGYCTTNQIFTCLFGYLQCRPTILTKNRNVDLLLIYRWFSQLQSSYY